MVFINGAKRRVKMDELFIPETIDVDTLTDEQYDFILSIHECVKQMEEWSEE